MEPREDLNPFTRATPLAFHDHLTLWNAYQSARERARLALVLVGLFAGALFVFSIVTAIDDAHQRTEVEAANTRATNSNIRTLRLIDYLNKTAKK